tara:strand:- start:57 stop:278 length:222 start_codon:yes stop_codon:yes gene_type:complete
MVFSIVISLKLLSKLNYKMWGKCSKKCERCEKYKNKYLSQKKRIEQLEEYMESILKTQKDMVELMEHMNARKK